jgi:hypothetical protein
MGSYKCWRSDRDRVPIVVGTFHLSPVDDASAKAD